MQPLAIVKHFDVIKDFGFCLIPRLEPAMPGQFILQVRKEALRHRVIITVALLALTLDHPMVMEDRLVARGAVERTTVAVVNQS